MPMTKLVIAFACLCAAATASIAGPDEDAKRAEAQKKIDETKVKGCESLRTAMSKNKNCPDQNAAAAKITCTKDTFAQMQTLFSDCSKAVKDKVGATKDANAAK